MILDSLADTRVTNEPMTSSTLLRVGASSLVTKPSGETESGGIAAFFSGLWFLVLLPLEI